MTQTRIRDVPPTERCWWRGFHIQVERHARRTTFARVLQFADARIQLKHSEEVQYR